MTVSVLPVWVLPDQQVIKELRSIPDIVSRLRRTVNSNTSEFRNLETGTDWRWNRFFVDKGTWIIKRQCDLMKQVTLRNLAPPTIVFESEVFVWALAQGYDTLRDYSPGTAALIEATSRLRNSYQRKPHRFTYAGKRIVEFSTIADIACQIRKRQNSDEQSELSYLDVRSWVKTLYGNPNEDQVAIARPFGSTKPSVKQLIEGVVCR